MGAPPFMNFTTSNKILLKTTVLGGELQDGLLDFS
jgi:hypothetical protein